MSHSYRCRNIVFRLYIFDIRMPWLNTLGEIFFNKIKMRQQPWWSVCNYEMYTFNKYTKIQRVCLRGIKLFSHNVPSSMRVFYSQSCSMLPSFLCEQIKVGCEKKERLCCPAVLFQPQINLISGKGGIFNNTSRLEIHANANFMF